MVIPVVYDLLPRSPYTMLVPGDNYYWASPVTAHTWQIEPEWGALPGVAYARFRVQSTVENTTDALFRLAAFDDGLVNPIPMAYVTNTRPGNGNISNDGVLFDAALRNVLALNTHKNIGWQLAGDNTHPVVIYSVRLEIGWAM